MVFEFFGPPGSGKSWTAEDMSRKRGIPVIVIRGRIEKYARAKLFVLTHPIAASFFLYKLLAENISRPALLHHKMRNLFLNTLAREQKALLKRGDCIIDEGLCQLVLSIYERKASREELERYLYFIPRNRHIYFVEGTRNMRAERMKKRGRVPRGRFGPSYISSWLPIFEYNYSIAKKLIEKTFSNTTINTQ